MTSRTRYGRMQPANWELGALILVAALVHGSSPSLAQETASKTSSPPALKSVSLVVLSTMLADTAGVGEWGFAALVEANGHRLLFDTGSRPETVLRNAQEMKIDLSGVTEVILSHHHGDHTGGLVTLRRELNRKSPNALSKAYVGQGIFLSRPEADGRESNEALVAKREFEALGGSFVEIDRPTQLFPGVWLTGPVPRDSPGAELVAPQDGPQGRPEGGRYRARGYVAGARYRKRAGRDLRLRPRGNHQYPRIRAPAGSSCPRLRGPGRVSSLRGRCVHTRLDSRQTPFVWTQTVPGAHCTGIESVFVLRQRLGLDRKTCAVGAVGSRFDLQTGLDPGRIAR